MLKKLLKQTVESSSEEESDSDFKDESKESVVSTISQVELKHRSFSKIDDGVDNDDFELELERRVAAIEREMLTYGDDKFDANDLRNVEFRIQSERILTVLDRCIKNVEIGFYLPLLLKSSKAEHFEALEALTRTQRLKIQTVYEELEGQDESINQEISKSLFEEILCLAHAHRFDKICPFETNAIPEASLHFLEKLRELRKLAEFRIAWTAPKAMAKEKRLHAMWKENEVTSAKVDEMYEQVARDKERMEQKVRDNETHLNQRCDKVRELDVANAELISKTMYVSNLRMNKISVDSQAKQNELQAAVNEAQRAYDAMLADNLVKGKKMRENKLKAQQKLQSWLIKYDSDVGERSQELFKLKDEMEEVTIEMEKWTKKVEDQEDEYNEVMELILAEQIRIRDEKVRLFSMNFAARKIQRAVRRMIKKRKQQKKKANKGKKKK